MKSTCEEIKQFLIDSLYLDFGFIMLTDEIEHWPYLSWTEFVELLKCQEIDLSKSLNRTWREFFHIEKEKFLLMERMAQKNPFADYQKLISSLNYN
jgi:hypothetical protein